MNLNVSSQAAQWYKDEMNAGESGYIRFFVRYGGCSNIQSGFSLGVTAEEPVNVGISTETDGITFYIEEKDLWYFDGHNMNVELDEQAEEPVFNYH